MEKRPNQKEKEEEGGVEGTGGAEAEAAAFLATT